MKKLRRSLIIFACTLGTVVGVTDCKRKTVKYSKTLSQQSPLPPDADLCQQMHAAFDNTARHGDLLTNDQGQNLSFEDHLLLLMEDLSGFLDEVQDASGLLENEPATTGSPQQPAPELPVAGTIEGEIAAFLANSTAEDRAELQGDMNEQAQMVLATQAELAQCIGISGSATEMGPLQLMAPARRPRNKTYTGGVIPAPGQTRFTAKAPKSRNSDGTALHVIEIPARSRVRAMQRVAENPRAFNEVLEFIGGNLSGFVSLDKLQRSKTANEVTVDDFSFHAPNTLSNAIVIGRRYRDGTYPMYVDLQNPTLVRNLEPILTQLGQARVVVDGNGSATSMSASTLVLRIRVRTIENPGEGTTTGVIVEDVRVRSGKLGAAMTKRATSPNREIAAQYFQRYQNSPRTAQEILLSKAKIIFNRIVAGSIAVLYVASIPFVFAKYTIAADATLASGAGSTIWFMPAIFAAFYVGDKMFPDRDF